MKISKIEVKDFRAFPGSEIYTFDLQDGKNLLLYGENGSGKSSIARALAEFLNTDPNARPFSEHKHRYFAPDAEDGHITLYLTDGDPKNLTWPFRGSRPVSDNRIADAALRKGFLEYRSLLRTNFVEGPLDERLFSLVVNVLLRNVPVSLPGQPERTIGWYWDQAVKNKPKKRYRSHIASAASAANQFNTAFRAILPAIQKNMRDLLKRFDDPWMEVDLNFPGIAVDKASKDYINRQIGLNVTYRGVAIQEHPDSLNEARLSALGLALYFAAIKLSNPTPPPGVVEPLRLLVLDDVLIGLDMANRLPVLRAIQDLFSEWQVFLFTYDRAWFEIAKQHLQGWVHMELFAVRVGDHERPLLLPDKGHLYSAIEFLEAGQVKAAAVHVRTEFEIVLKRACKEMGLPVKYREDNRKVPASDLWAALKAKCIDFHPAKACHLCANGRVHTWQPSVRGVTVVPCDLVKRIEQSISWVLNPLSHSEPVDRYRREIEEAIYAVDTLDKAIRLAVSGELGDLIVQRELLLRVLKSRTGNGKSKSEHPKK